MSTTPIPFPSPTPPWHRPVQSPDTQTINEDLIADGISLNSDVTYLDSTVPKNASDLTEAYEVALPNGNYKRQIKRIFIPGANFATTAAFKITGTFNSTTAYTFGIDGGQSAVFEWDGSDWHLIGGNAQSVEA